MRSTKIRKRKWTLNLILFLATACTTTAVGALYANTTFDSWPSFLLRGWVFSAPLMAILLVHEMGHYLTARRRGLDVTPPYFIPAIPPLGTFGAFIKIRSPIPDRRALVEIGALGPISGAVLAVPILMVGLLLSEARPPTGMTEGVSLGSSIILELLCLVRFGHFSWNMEIILHPTALAAWFGLFVTSMNLLPIGQLDGGHVIYSLFGHRVARFTSWGFLFLLIPLGIILWRGWLVFGLMTTILGLNHPPPLDPYRHLGWGGYALGWIAIILFLMSFIPVPLSAAS